jgi:riboflavin transporter FmnP
MCCCCPPRCSLIFVGVWCLVSSDHKQKTTYHKKVSLPINVISMEFNIHIADVHPLYFQLFENLLLQSSNLNTVLKNMLLLFTFTISVITEISFKVYFSVTSDITADSVRNRTLSLPQIELCNCHKH